MSATFAIVRAIHILAAATALLVLWVPIAAKKGGKLHVRAGWVYVVAMGVVALSALALSTLRLVDSSSDLEARSLASFLSFVAVLASSSCWHGVRALRDKTRTGAHKNPVDLAVSVALVAAGVACSIYGFAIVSPLLSWFPLLGVVVGARQLAYWLRAPQEKRHWWLAHMGGMFASCIATITAFVVFGAPRLLGTSQRLSPIVWFLPTIILVPALLAWQRYYRRRFRR